MDAVVDGGGYEQLTLPADAVAQARAPIRIVEVDFRIHVQVAALPCRDEATPQARVRVRGKALQRVAETVQNDAVRVDDAQQFVPGDTPGELAHRRPYRHPSSVGLHVGHVEQRTLPGDVRHAFVVAEHDDLQRRFQRPPTPDGVALYRCETRFGERLRRREPCQQPPGPASDDPYPALASRAGGGRDNATRYARREGMPGS